VLSTVLHVVAANSGITAEEIDKVDRQVQKLGITATSSRQSLTQFLQARLDLKFAPQLARAAQDLAVISGMDSSATFQRLILNIQQLDAMGLRWMGIVVDRTQAEEKYKEAIGATGRELTKREQQAALAQEVLNKAVLLQGTYSNAMNDVSKQVQSLTRLTDTYRQVLGESLLPAYSVIVAKIGEMFEKLIILGREFSSNKERAQSLAEVADVVATAFTNLAVFVAEHLEGIIQLVKWYIELRVFLLFFRGAEIYLMWMIKAIDWINKLRLGFMALQTGMVGFRVALSAMGAASVVESAKLLEVAVAQGAVAATAPAATSGIAATGLAAQGASMAVSGLVIAWTALAATLAIPVIGYIIYKIKTQRDEIPLLERARQARDQPQRFSSGRPGEEIEVENPEFRQTFELWKKENPGLVRSLQTDVALMKEFNRQLDAFGTNQKIDTIADEIAAQRMVVQAAEARRQNLRADTGATPGEKEAADRNFKEAAERLEDLRKEMNETFNFVPQFKGTQALLDQIEKAGALQRELGRVRDAAKAGRAEESDIQNAEAKLEVEKARLNVGMAQHEEALKADTVMSESVKNAERVGIARKLEIQGLTDSADAMMEARKQLFGEKFTFGTEGISTGAFSTAIGAYTALLTEAKKILDREGKVPKQLADQLRQGLESLGQAAKLPLDLTRLKAALPQIQAFEGAVPGITAKARQAVEVARLATREQRLEFGAPIVAEQVAQTKLASDKKIAEAQRYLDRLKTLLGNEALAYEDLYRDGLINLNEYYKRRMDRIRQEGGAEAQVQSLQIAALESQKAIPGQAARVYDQLQLQINAARSQLATIQGQTENRLDTERNALEDRVQSLSQQAVSGRTGIVAARGGQAEALRQLDYQLEQERKKFAELEGTEEARFRDQYLALKRIVDTAEIYRKFREEAYQVEIGIETQLQSQLDLQQKTRDIAASRDRAAVTRGTLPEDVARRRENARIEEQMYDTLVRRESKQRELAVQERRFDTETLKLREELSNPALGLTPIEVANRVSIAQQQWTNEIIATRGAVLDLDAQYATLAATTQRYSDQIKTSFVSGVADALTSTTQGLEKAGQAWVSFARRITDEIVGIFAKAFTQRVFSRLSFGFMDRLMGFGGGGGRGLSGVSTGASAGEDIGLAGGGVISGPGTGTSDSVPIWASAGEHVMPASKTAQFLPLLEGIRTGRILPYATGGVVQSIARMSLIPRHYAGGGVVTTDAGAASVQTGGGGVGNMVVTMHPDTLNMTMREWLEHEVVRQQGRR
jgi:hypothetical protein